MTVLHKTYTCHSPHTRQTSWAFCPTLQLLCPRRQANSTACQQTTPSAATTGASVQPEVVHPAGSVLQLTTADGSMLWGEVLSSEAGAMQVAVSGRSYSITPAPGKSGAWTSQEHGPLLSRSDPLLTSFPGWSQHTDMLCGRVEDALTPGQQSSVGVEAVGSLDELLAAVQADARPWTDGTGPSDPPLSPQQTALLTAGELAAFLTGQRGLAMLQLAAAWDKDLPQPALRPLVITLLRRIVSTPGIKVVISATPGNSGLGLTAIFAADREPWSAWAAHLAGFGCQSALEAQSPYYKLLIGTMLGYKPEHVLAHIRERDGPGQPSPATAAAVQADMAKLSRKAPRLPWTAAAGGRGSRKKAPVGAGTASRGKA